MLRALHIMEHLLVSQDDNFQLDYRWAYIVASRVASADSWVQTWAQKAPVSFFTSRLFSAITLQLPHHGATLIQASIKVHMDPITTGISKNTRRARSVKFATSLIEESLKLHERLAEGHDCVMPTLELSRHERYDGEIERLARTLFEEHELEPGSWQKSVALSLALHSLYAAVTTSPESTMAYDGVSSWVELIESRAAVGICSSDFDVVVQAYGTLPNLNSLALMLDAVGLYSLAMTLIDVMLVDFYVLEDATCRSLRDSCDVTIQSLEALQKEVKERRLKNDCEIGWVYDDVMETWVEATPKSSKTLTLPIDTFIETDAYESDDENQDAYPATPTRRRNNSTLESTSRNAFPYGSQSYVDSPPSPSTQHSPFVMRRPIRYSMTPVRRITRQHRKLGRYSKDGSDSETGLDDDEGVYAAPVDLEVYARYAIEDDSDNEDLSQHGLRSSAGSDSEDNFSENTAPNSWNSSSSSASSDGGVEDDNGSASEVALHDDDDEVLEHGAEHKVVTRSSRRRIQGDKFNPPMSPTVIILSDGTNSDAEGSFGEVESDTFSVSDEDNQQSKSDSSESELGMTMRTSQRRQESESMDENDSERVSDDFSGEEVYVISDDDDVAPNDKSGEESSQESHSQPNYRRRVSQQRHALNTPESEPDADTSDYCDEPALQRKNSHRTQRRHILAKQGKQRSPSPLPTPPQEPPVEPSRIRLRKKRAQNYALLASEGSVSDDSMESDYQQSVKKKQSKSRLSRSTRSSHSSKPPISLPRPEPASKHPRGASKSKVVRVSNGHGSMQEDIDSNEESESDGLHYRSASTRPSAPSHPSKRTVPGHHALSRRKRRIIYNDEDDNDRSDSKDDDYSGEYGDDQSYVSPGSDSDSVAFNSTLQVSKTRRKRRAKGSIRGPSESSDSDSLPRIRTRRRAFSNQPRARKRVRIQDDDDEASDDLGKTSNSDYGTSPRKVSRESIESRGISSRANPRMIVAEDSLDETTDFQQISRKSGRSWANTTQAYTKQKPRSPLSSTSTPNHRISKATRVEERFFRL
ncbi:hypothetical protein EC991_003181 [Linnemannia zychae]|nr:hypothetical protein EC991_003181 [Linnemannia zychae]